MYDRLWRLEYSPSKTKCIVFGDRKRKHIDNYQWFLGDQRLEIVTSYNYLGIIISGDGLSQNRTTIMANKGYANLGMLKASGFHSERLSPLTCSSLWQRLFQISPAWYVLSYLTGVTLENKKLWTQIVDQTILTHEQRRWKAEFVDKGAHRFLRLHESLRPSVLFSIIKCKMECRNLEWILWGFWPTQRS
jgi:hypothetical protein